jgi:hypothetical protein
MQANTRIHSTNQAIRAELAGADTAVAPGFTARGAAPSVGGAQ